MLQRYEKFLSLLIAKRRSSSVVTLRKKICHLGGMNDAKLFFVSPWFQFCLCAEAVMAAHLSFVIKGINETLEWFQ